MVYRIRILMLILTTVLACVIAFLIVVKIHLILREQLREPKSAEAPQAVVVREEQPHGPLQIGSGSSIITRSWEVELDTKTGTVSPAALQKRLEITGVPTPPKDYIWTESGQSSIRLFSVVPTWQCELGHGTNFVYRDATSTPERVEHPVYYCLEHLGVLLDQFQVPRATLKENERRK